MSLTEKGTQLAHQRGHLKKIENVDQTKVNELTAQHPHNHHQHLPGVHTVSQRMGQM